LKNGYYCPDPYPIASDIREEVLMPDQSGKHTSRIRLILTVALILIGLGLVLFFGGRAYRDFRRLQLRGLSPGVTDVEAIRGWMTVPYIANAYGVPETAIFEGLDVPQSGNEKLSITQLADKYGREPAEVRQAIQQAILRSQAAATPGAEGAP
jgi:hypothetical protein